MRVFDSMALVSDPLTPLVELQLSKIYNPHHSKSSIHVEIASVQQQEGIHEWDCLLSPLQWQCAW